MYKDNNKKKINLKCYSNIYTKKNDPWVITAGLFHKMKDKYFQVLLKNTTVHIKVHFYIQIIL